MITVDASVLVAHFSPGDVHRVAAGDLLRSLPAQTLFAHPLTLAEVLVGGVRARREHEMVAALRRLGVQAAEPSGDEPLRLAQLRVATGLKLPDCCVLDTALTNSAPLATFDAGLGAAAARLGVRIIS